MYGASNAFREAVRNNAEQICLMIFEDGFLSNSDINIDNGVSLREIFNSNDDISIGQATSSELDFSIFNDEGQFDGYEFGEFDCTIGVKLSEGTYTTNGNCYATDSSGNVYETYNVQPYLKKNRSSTIAQPGYKIGNLFIYKDILYGISDNFSRIFVLNLSTGASRHIDSCPVYMKKKLENIKYFSGSLNNNLMKMYFDGKTDNYEFVPLGRFNAERPNSVRNIMINFECYDQMQKFEKDMPSDTALGITYPVTHKVMLEKICSYTGVTLGSSSWINSNETISKRPDSFDHVTMREVIAWIAESACSNIRFNRDGILVMDWLKQTSVSIDENNYTSFDPYWYTVPKVDKLYNRNTDDGKEATSGTGDNAYLIQDNPFMQVVNN